MVILVLMRESILSTTEGTPARFTTKGLASMLDRKHLLTLDRWNVECAKVDDVDDLP